MARNAWRERLYLNKKAFDAIIGNKDEPGLYVKFKVRNGTQAMLYGMDGEPSTPNPAMPSRADFCCDVESAIDKALHGKNILKKFFEHYIIGKDSLSKEQQTRVEQLVGSQLRRRIIFPIGRYFTAVRGRKRTTRRK